MKIVKKIADGLYLIADSFVDERDYLYPIGNGRSQDMSNLTSDVRAVGNDMKKSIIKHGKRTYQLTSN